MRGVHFSAAMAFFALIAAMGASAEELECYDAKVRARPTTQIPSEYPTEPGRIVLSWPWFVDLKIKDVIDGNLNAKKITALAVLHSAFVKKTRTWLLRRNSLGGFNILRVADPDKIRQCGPNTGPAVAYLRPGKGESLADYRRRGEAELRRYSKNDDD